MAFFASSRIGRWGAFLTAAVVLGVPAVFAHALCLGQSCAASDSAARTPFCGLPTELRRLVVAGFREERSPDVLAVAAKSVVGASSYGAEAAPEWPSARQVAATRVPLAFLGTGVNGTASIAAGTGLDDVGPTLAEIIDFDIPHPEVRSGRPLALATGEPPRLVLEIVLKGLGSSDIEARPQDSANLRRLVERGAGTLHARVGSLPLDPAAILTTIGTGGLPRQHGVVGAMFRDDGGDVVRAWERARRYEVTNVIATLADDYDERRRQRPEIGLAGTATHDLGVIGGRWYLRRDRDAIAMVPDDAGVGRQVRAAKRLLTTTPFGKDALPDILAVVLTGGLHAVDDALPELVDAAARAAGGSVATVVTATGAARPSSQSSSLGYENLREAVDRSLPTRGSAIEATAVGGFFLDQRLLSRAHVSQDRIVRALSDVTVGREPALQDVFPKLAVVFSRYC